MTPDTERASLIFERWPRFAMRHPWFVVAPTFGVLLTCAVLYLVAAGSYGDAFSIPGAESQRLVEFLKERFPANSGDSVYVVVHSEDGLTDPQQKARVETLLAGLSSLPGVANVASPYAEPGRPSS